MDTLKKFFPLSFKRAGSVADLVIGIIIYAVASILSGGVIAIATLLTSWLPLVGGITGTLLGIIGSLAGLYCTAGIVIEILVFCKVIKD